MDRRDFFGIIAAPLFRNLVPPTPIDRREWLIPPPPLSIASNPVLKVRSDDGHWSAVARITDLSSREIKVVITGPVEWL